MTHHDAATLITDLRRADGTLACPECNDDDGLELREAVTQWRRVTASHTDEQGTLHVTVVWEIGATSDDGDDPRFYCRHCERRFEIPTGPDGAITDDLEIEFA